MKLFISPRLLPMLLLISFSAIFTSGQAEENEEAPHVRLGDGVMRQVVNEVLRRKFKPSGQTVSIEIYDKDVRREWLPAIKNTRFILLSMEEVLARKKGVYFFTDVQKENFGEFSIGLGFGDPFCSYGGSNWVFDAKDVRGSIRPDGGVGGGCSSISEH